MANAIQDLRKVKVADVMSQNLTAGLISATSASADCSANISRNGNNGDPEVDHVIERCLDNEIEKPQWDTYSYR